MIIKIFWIIVLTSSIFGQFEECNNINKKQNSKLKRDCQRIEDLNCLSNSLNKSFKIHLNYTHPETIYLDTSINFKFNWHPKSDLKQLIKEGFIKNLPLDPINNNEYYYSYEPLNNKFYPYYQLCVSKLETTKKPYCLEPPRYAFYSDHLFIESKINIPSNKIKLTIVSANILYGGGSPEAPSEKSSLGKQLKVLKNSKADIVLLQEVELYTARTLSRDKSILNEYQTVVDYFKNNLSLGYFYFEEFSNLGIGVTGKLFLSKYPILVNKKINKHLSVIGIDINDNHIVDLLVANIHVKPKNNLHGIKKMIDKSVKKLIRFYPKIPIILGGDFYFNNLNLKKYGFMDTYLTCGYKNKQELQYKKTTISIKERRIDYIFVRNIECSQNSNKILLPLFE